MNWVEILIVIVGAPAAAYKLYQWGHRRGVRKAAEARADSLCTDGCGATIDVDKDVLFKGHWYKPECWRALNS
jgi:hypothetical protein